VPTGCFFSPAVGGKVGLLNEHLHYCMDYEYWLRMGELTPFVRIRDVLAGSRMYQTNKTLRARVAVHLEIIDMLLERIGYVPDKWIYSYAHAVVEGKGLTRDSAYRNIKFVHALIVVAVTSFLRWQRRLPFRAIRTMAAWSAGSLYRFMKQSA
jgi:hypothetical protein